MPKASENGVKTIGSANVPLEHSEPRSATGKVVHLVDPVTDDVFSFLEPATSALAKAHVEQSIVFVNRPRLHLILSKMDASVRVVVTPPARNPIRRWLWALRAFRTELQASPTQGVHLYGRLPSIIGTWVARRAGVPIGWHYAANTQGRPARIGSIEAMPTAGASKPTMPDQAEQIDISAPHHQSAVMERPVSDELLTMARVEARQPLVVTSGQMNDPRSADLFAQLAVLLGGADLGLAFNWIGSVDDTTRPQLKAAQVGVFSANSPAEWAARLAAGWVYLAPGGTSGFPTQLVDAMALGLPCIALDTPDHREVIRHGETGFLCRTAEEIVNCIAPLLDSSEFRRTIGQAARDDVEQRFGEARFRDTLLAAYQLPPAPPRSSMSTFQ